MKKVMKKFFYIVMSLLMMFSLVNENVSDVDATHFDLKEEFISGWTNRGGIWGTGTILKVNDEVSFCLQALKPAHIGDNEEIKPSDIGLSDEQMKVLVLISWYGYRSQPSITNYFLTQNLIWDYLGDGHCYVTHESYPTKKSMQSWFETVMNKVNHFDDLVSFHDESYTIDVDETLTLEDTNGVLEGLSVKDVTGVAMSKEGNTLKITPSLACDDTFDIVFHRGMSDAQTKTNFIVRNGNSQSVSRLTGEDSYASSIHVNVQKFGSLKITKKDNAGKVVPHTSFQLSYQSDMSSPIGRYTTGSDGTITIDHLLSQTVYIQEVEVPSHLLLDSTIHQIEIKTGETVSFVATNQWKQGYIEVVKKDEETNKVVQKEGIQFEIYNSSHQKVATLSTDKKGVAKSGLLDYGTYYVKEVLAPYGYTIKVEVSDDIDVVENQRVYEVVVKNKRVKGTVHLMKEDSVTKHAQGDATLQGAVYGLYARHDIVDPSDDETILYKAGTKIKELVTDKDGKAEGKLLDLGDYYVKELKPSYGYNLDKNEYDFSLVYDNQNVQVVTKNIHVLERVVSQAFSIIKISSDEAGEADLLEGAEFTVKAKKDIEKYGSFEKAPIALNAQGKETSVLVTDKQGYAVSQRLPIGTYVVRETKSVNDKYKVEDFEVVVKEDSSEPQPYRVFNDTSFLSVLSIVKADKETGKVVKVKGAEFKIKNLDTNEYFGYWSWSPLPHYVNSWTTDETGTVMTSEKLKTGHYQLEEIASPNGYLLSQDPVLFTISSQTAYQVLPDGKTPVITVTKQDTPVKGQITVDKRGEVLVGFNDNRFQYEERSLPNAKFHIYAKEDVMDPSNDGTVLYKKGTLVETLITDHNGATSKKLPLGIYEVEEVLAPHGMVIQHQKATVVLKYKDQNTPVVFKTVSISNDRQKVDAKLIKKDSFDQSIGLKDAEFDLITMQDVFSYDGQLIVKGGTVLNHYVTDEKGMIGIDLDLPVDYKWKLIETKAPMGYVLEKSPILFSTDYQGQDVQTIIIEKIKLNERTYVDVSKIDITTKQELPGNTLCIYEKDRGEGAKFITWISSKTPKRIENLEINTRYVLKEEHSVKGFMLADDIEFELDELGNVYLFNQDGQRILAENHKIIMENDLQKGKLEWDKKGEVFNYTDTGQTEFGVIKEPVWEISRLLQSEITIYAAEDIVLGNGVTYYKKDEKVQTLESDLDKVSSKDLLVGHYYYKETKVPHGYLVDTDKHYFEIKDQHSTKLQLVQDTLNNERPKAEIELTKVMEKYKHHPSLEDVYQDVIFGIYAREDIYTYKGSVGIENGTLIATTGIDDKGHLIHMPDLPNGVYYLKELQTHQDYVLDEKEYDFEISYHGQDVSCYKVMIGQGEIDNQLIKGSIEIKKQDSFDKKALQDVQFHLSVHRDMKNVIATSYTDENGIARFENLEIGKYFVQEVKQVNGYVYNDHVYEVDISKNNEVVMVTVSNQPTQMIFNKVDEKNQPLAKSLIEIIDQDTGKTVERWMSTNESHIVRYLEIGKSYIMRELRAPNGYKLASDVEFIANDGTTITMKDELILTNIQVQKLDAQSKKPILSQDFIFGIYSDKECHELLKEVHADKKDGTVTFEDLKFGTYYIQERIAPSGYLLSEEIKEVVIDDNLNDVGKTHCIVFMNQKVPEVTDTSDSTSMIMLGIGILSFIGIILLKKREEEK